MNHRPAFRGGREAAAAAILAAIALFLIQARPAEGYTRMQGSAASSPPVFWASSSQPLPTLISSAGSDNVPDTSDTSALIAAEQAWTDVNTGYFVFATPTVGTGTALSSTDGRNSIFFDETGANFAPGSTTIAFTTLNWSASTGIITNADMVFNGALTFSTATPTPAGAFDIQSIATHELGHLLGLGHTGLLNAVMFPYSASGKQFQRVLTSDDWLGCTAIYPEVAGGAGMAGLQEGDGDLLQMAGSISGKVRTAGGTPVPGAHVVALDPNGLAVVSDVSRPDGSYALTGLFPGSYQVYAEPLDGMLVESSLSQSRSMNAFTPFNTTFLGGNAAPGTVTVAAGSVSPGNLIDLGNLYAVETESNGSPGGANPLPLETLMSGVVNPGGDADYYSFPGTAGDIISIDLDAGGDGLPLDTLLTLFSTDGTTSLASSDDFAGKGADSRVVRKLAATGTFYARVTDFSGTAGGPGSFYTLHVNRAVPETEGNDTQASANPAAPGQYRGGVITSSDSDFYSFTANLGDRIIAEVTANRAGSTLDPNLALINSAGTVLTSSTDITAGSNLDSKIDYTFSTGVPGIFYLRVTAASGSGSGAFYVLTLGTDTLNTIYSAVKPLGAGLSTSTSADIFPKFVSQGSSFDFVAVGNGIPQDAADTITVSGAGISTSPTTAALSFKTSSSGLDYFAYSVSLGAGAPGPHTVFFQNATLKSALSGGLVVNPTTVPPEAGRIDWSGEQLLASRHPLESAWNVYRGSLPLVDADLNGLADSYGAPFACGRISPQAADPGAPPAGEGYFYIVAGRDMVGEATLGFARNDAGAALERPRTALTISCP